MHQQNCPICDKEFNVPGKQHRVYCSMCCLKKGYSERFKGDKNPNYRNAVKPCEGCGGKKSKNAKKHCRKCRGKAIQGENNPFYGKQHTEEFKDKMSENRRGNTIWQGRKHTEESKKKMGESQKKSWENKTDQEKSNVQSDLKRGLQTQLEYKETLPEKIFRELLEDNNIKFSKNRYMYDKFFVDFYLPEINSIVEIFGDYWHSNPQVYTESSQNDMQKNQQKKDKARIAYLEKCGHDVYVFWEKDLKTNKDEIEQRVKEIYNASNLRKIRRNENTD